MPTTVDGCIERSGRPKTAGMTEGVVIYLVEEIGDARLRAAQLKRYIDDARKLVEDSEHKDHIFEVAGHLMHGIPDALFKLEKALQACALGVARLDYEEIKNALKPEKSDELETAMKDVRIRQVQRRSEEITPMNRKQAAANLIHLAEIVEQQGILPTLEVHAFLSQIEGPPGKLASVIGNDKMSKFAKSLRTFAKVTMEAATPPSRQALGAALRRLMADTYLAAPNAPMPGPLAGAGEDFQKHNPGISDEEAAKIDAEHEKNKDNFKA